jgi:catechol 2,3-dioxygenase-like lactoylglutathione lyase family enzyme
MKMLNIRSTFSSFSVDDLDRAERFYSDVTGLHAERNSMGLKLHLPGGAMVFVYPKQDHKPATFTVLNFVVNDLGEAMKHLKSRGVQFEYYEGLTDEDHIMHGIAQNRGPDIAWFKDPAGNIISILQELE